MKITSNPCANHASPLRALPNLRRAAALSFGIVAFLGLAACGSAPVSQGISDPHEARNRAVHRVNVALDKNVLRPLANSANKIVPDEVAQSVVNFSGNLELPGMVVNNILQMRLGKAVENTARFVINTTYGLGGLFDPATAAGVPGTTTDFGETLFVWGVGEGHYVELPFFGPSTQRDAFGKLVDYGLDPLRLVLPSDNRLPLLAKVGSKIADRARYSETVDSVLYDSADSYAQTRLFYLDHRRYKLGQAPSEDSFEDPYAQ